MILAKNGLVHKRSILDESRSGEWGDHVTLQAAADSVWIF